MTERITLSLWEPLPASVVAEAFVYDPDTGLIRWRESGKGRHTKKGGVVGFKKGGSEYLAVKYQRKRLMLHRLAWCLHHGYWPEVLVDHINGNPSDNRIANLRLGDKRLNAENQRHARSDNATGVLGVRKHGNKFLAHLRSQGERFYLGLHATPEAAHEAYLKAKRELHKGCTI